MSNSLKNVVDISPESLIVDLFLIENDFSMFCFQDDEYLKLLHKQQIEMNELKIKHKEQKEDLIKGYFDNIDVASSVLLNS
jgi:hypothetical protein